MPCESCVSRREFLASASGAAGLVALAGCGDGVLSGLITAPAPGVFDPVTVIVANFPGLANLNELVSIPNRWFAVKRTGATSFEAFSKQCTHEGCLVSITNGVQFDCGCHGSRFANDGTVLRGPATLPLTQFNTSYAPATDELTISS